MGRKSSIRRIDVPGPQGRQQAHCQHGPRPEIHGVGFDFGEKDQQGAELPGKKPLGQPQRNAADAAGDGGFQQRQGRCHIRRPEKHPGDVDEQKRHGPAEPLGQGVPTLAPQPLRHLGQTVEHAPEDEGPACAVPDAADQIHQQDIQIGAALTLPAAPQRKVDVFPEEGRQGHVPALPELRHRQAAVGRIEVDGQTQPQQPGTAGGNVAVAGEIEVQLQGVAQDDAPGGGGRQAGEVSPAVVGQNSQVVRQQHLFGKAQADGIQPRRRVPGLGSRLPQLGKKF